MTPFFLAAGILHGSLAAGAGSAFDFAGARLELRSGHVALSAALGESIAGINLIDSGGAVSNRGADIFPALSLRFFSGDGEDFFVATTWTNHAYERNFDDPCCFDRSARMQTVTATVGWRFRFATGLYFEIAAGGGAAIRQGHPSASGHDSTPGPFRRDVLPIPDGALAIGFEL